MSCQAEIVEMLLNRVIEFRKNHLTDIFEINSSRSISSSHFFGKITAGILKKCASHEAKLYLVGKSSWKIFNISDCIIGDYIMEKGGQFWVKKVMMVTGKR
jgi:hypothetical protein